MKGTGMKWLAAALLLASCAPTLENIKSQPCQEQSPPDTTLKVGHVVFVSVDPATGVFKTVVIDMEKSAVVETNGGKTSGELASQLEAMRKLDSTTLAIVMKGSPNLNEILSRPVPPPPPPPATDWLILRAKAFVRSYQLMGQKLDAFSAESAALKK